jgi:histidyl-tRNA synthetase
MRDLLPDDAEMLTYVMSKARETAELYGYREVITPVIEPYELLSAKSGEEIRQRMFTFDDMGKRRVALRPEFTSSIARLATTAFKNEPKPFRTLSIGSVYRYDEPPDEVRGLTQLRLQDRARGRHPRHPQPRKRG